MKTFIRLASCVPTKDIDGRPGFDPEDLPVRVGPDAWPRPIDWVVRDEETGKTYRLTERETIGAIFDLTPVG